MLSSPPIARRLAWMLLAVLTVASPVGAEPPRAHALPGMRADVAALLLYADPGGSLIPDLRWTRLDDPDTARADTVRLLLWIELDGDRLLNVPPEVDVLHLELHVYALRGASRTVAGSLSQMFRPRLDQLPMDLVGLRLGALLELSGTAASDATPLELRLLVRETRTDRVALRVLRLESLDPPPAVEGGAREGWLDIPPPDPVPVGAPAPETLPYLGEISRRAAASPSSAAAARREAARRQAARREATDRTERRKKSVRALRRNYREILEQVSQGGAQGGLADTAAHLAELESTVLDERPEDAASLLSEAQDGLAVELAQGAPEGLVPLLAVHLGAHDRHLAARRWLLVSLARGRLVALARLYAEHGDADLAPRRAADILVTLAAPLERRQRAVADGLYEEALQLDPSHAGARLRRAASHEQRGAWAEAAAELEHLLEHHPSDASARLCLAVNLRRMGRPEAAAPLLRQLIDGSDARDAWRAVVAYQELARAQLDAERFAEAVLLLERAVARYPEEHRLAVLLAYAHDRLGESRAAHAALDAAPRTSAEPSPRSRYAREGRLERRTDARDTRRDLLRDAFVRLPILIRALAEDPAKQRGERR